MSIEEQSELARQTPMGRPNGTPGWTQEDEDARRAAGVSAIIYVCEPQNGKHVFIGSDVCQCGQTTDHKQGE